MAKSTRIKRNGQTSEVGAGSRERVATHCPPDMTESVKAALEKEIEQFKADPENAKIARMEAEASGAEGKCSNDYQTWLALHRGREPLEANPDIVPDEDGLIYSPSVKDDNMVRLLKEFRQTLTARQLQVWNLMMKHQMSFRKTAELLDMPKHTVEAHLRRAKAKFTKFMEDAKNAGQ